VKTVLRAIFLNMVILYLAVMIYPGLSLDGSIRTLFLATIGLTLLNRIVRPMIKLLLLPINLITLGFFGWVSHVATLFILTRVVSGVTVSFYYFPGLSYNGFAVPAMNISTFASYFLASITISLLASMVGWLLKK
jgi:putative membrane protein